MPQSKHTPGPWCIESVFSEALHDIALDYNIPGCGSPILIATVFDADEDSTITKEQANANARLIAAAPELLAACEAWDQGFSEWEGFDQERFLLWVNKNREMARAAIAKVNGRK